MSEPEYLRLAAISGSQTTRQIAKQKFEYAVSQVYIALDASDMMGVEVLNETSELVAEVYDPLKRTTWRG